MHRRRFAITLVEALVIVAIVIAFCLSTVTTSRGPTGPHPCMYNLKVIGLALQNYEADRGTLPPAYTIDKEGNRLHSWRTLILPYMGQKELYKSIDLTKPWDDPANSQARETVIEAYQCPISLKQLGLTNYLAVVGPDCAFTGHDPRKKSDIKDGIEETISVIDVGKDRAVPWMSPQDINADTVIDLLPELETNHTGTIFAAFLDCRVRAISQKIDTEALHALLTVAGGEAEKEPF